MTKQNLKWEESGGPSGNILLRGDGFFISYMPDNGLGFFLMFESDGGIDETALCNGGKYYILNGDFRNEYEELLDQGFDSCLAFFKKNIDKISTWSDKPDYISEIAQ